MIEKLKKTNFVRIGLLLMLLGVVLWGTSMPKDVTIYSHEPFATLENGWTQILGEDTVELEQLGDYITLAPGTPLVLARTVTADMVGQCLLFYAEHQEVFVAVGEKLVYSLTCPPSLSAFASPGRSWVSVPITAAMVGETLQLSLESQFAPYHSLPSEIYCVEESSIYAVQVDFLFLRNTAAILMIALALTSYIMAFLWKQKRLRQFLFGLADLYLCIGLWLCAEVNVLAIWLGRAPISAVLAMVLSRVIPIMFYYFFASILPYSSWRMKLAEGLVWGNLVISMILQIVFGVSLLSLMSMHLAVILAGCILGLVEIGYYHGSGMQFLGYTHACYGVVLILLAAFAECYIYIHYSAYGKWMGVFLSGACVVYFVITHLFLINIQATTAEEKYQLEQTMFNLHKHTLNQQINAHFLYNSLNTISAFCKKDPDQAYEAIRLMGQYMRTYTQLLGANDYVALEDELDLMQMYMAIQNMRFHNSVKFSVRNTCDDVLLPPMTLQPLVENAVNHGIRKRTGCGEITITTCYKYNMAEIVVSDDGAGFDVAQLKSSGGVGLRNLESRIKAMGGSLTVESACGKGTQVTLLVPMIDINLEEEPFEYSVCR